MSGPRRRAGSGPPRVPASPISGRRRGRAPRRSPASSRGGRPGAPARSPPARRAAGRAARRSSGREPLDEAEVELGAVAADEVHLARQARERRQVAERATGDDGDRGLRQRGERTDRGDRLGQRLGRGRVVDERRERAVVVAADEELRHPRDAAERRAQLGVERRCRGSAVRLDPLTPDWPPDSRPARRGTIGPAVDVVDAQVAAA